MSSTTLMPVGDYEFNVAFWSCSALSIEILSPDQTLRQLFDKCERYHTWGTAYCWVIDPEEPAAWEYHRNRQPALRPAAETLAAGEIRLPVAEIFSVLAD